MLLAAYVLSASLTVRPVARALAMEPAALAFATPAPALIPTPPPSPTPTTTATATPTPTPTPSVTPTATPTPPPVRVLRTYPIDDDRDLLPEAPIRILFDQAMDPSPATLAAVISPSVPLAVEWAAADHLVLRAPPWQPKTVYRLTLQAARSAQGGTLQQPLTLSFRTGERGAPIPILMYHHVRELATKAPAGEREWTVRPADFAAQMDLLAGLGAHVVPLGEVADYLAGGAPLPSRPVVITFDDGYRSPYERAVPILRARGWTATFFITPYYIGASAYLTWEELASLAREGHTLGGHGYRHVYVHNLSPRDAERELGEARRWIQEETRAQVDLFAYPYGAFSSKAAAQLQAHGYRAAVTIDPICYQSPSRLMTLSRIRMEYGEPVERLRAQLPWKE